VAVRGAGAAGGLPRRVPPLPPFFESKLQQICPALMMILLPKTHNQKSTPTPTLDELTSQIHFKERHDELHP
jgi:hypothetical protein